ncbi:MAG: NAD(P)-binding protein [Alphaproteobacteria bacterium]|nr:NAD(P)-binding protein [Alphaproteobacteria bacterium]
MTETVKVDIAVVGGGSGGLSVAAGAAQMGASVLLFEKGRMGGDCLNYGCVPSKAIIAAAHAASAFRNAGRFGIAPEAPRVDPAALRRHVQGVIASIAPHDSVERFEGLGVRVVEAPARFVGRRLLEGGGVRAKARWIVLATGSVPIVPPVPGLDRLPFLTNETVFDLEETPAHLLVLGGGPVGIELAQAHRRLGAAVTVVQRGPILPRDDADAAALIRARLVREGVQLLEHATVSEASGGPGNITLHFETGGRRQTAQGTHLLVAAGRRPDLEGLDLDAGGVAWTPAGVTVDARLRSSDRRVLAVGDVAGGLRFTHVAGYHAGIAIRNALFRIPARADTAAAPWVTYTDPELAHVGMTGAEAAETLGNRARVLRHEFSENDRARAERETEGFVKAVVGPRGRVLGATIVGPHAGELIQPWVLAVSQKLRIGALAAMIAPYPTLGELSKRAAGSYYTDALFGPRTRRLVRFLMRFA